MTYRTCYDCKTEDPTVPESGWIVCIYCRELRSLRAARTLTPRQRIALQEQHPRRVFILVVIWEGMRDGLEKLLFVNR